MYEKVAIITEIWHIAKCYFTRMNNALYLITVSKMNKKYHILFWDLTTLKIYEKITQITQIGYRGKFYFTCISSLWYLIMLPNMKKIHPAIIEECVRMFRRTDETFSYIPRFRLGGVGNNRIKPVHVLSNIKDDSLKFFTLEHYFCIPLIL